MPVYTQSIAAESRVLGPEQAFNFNRDRSVFRLSNVFIPNLNISNKNILEFRNHNHSGFRFAHETQYTEDSGSLRLMIFSSGLLNGTSIMTVNASSLNISIPLLVLPPTQPNHASTKGYVDSKPLNTFAVPTGDVNLSACKIINLAAPISSADAATKGYVDSKPLNTFTILTGNISLNNYKVTNLATPISSADAATKGYTDALVPPGCMLMWCGNYSIPNGWLLCDGSSVSRTTYAALFNAIGAVWGNGNGFSTFNLPDGRGFFPRGVSGSSGRDPDISSRYNSSGGASGNSVGTYQDDSFKMHYHEGSTSLEGGHNHDSRGYFTAVTSISAGLISFITKQVRARFDVPNDPRDAASGTPLYSVENHRHTVSTAYSGDNETRPKNFSINFIIKY